MAHLPSSKAREGFADTINRVAFGKERVVLRRRGKEVAAVVSMEDLRLLEDLEDRIDLVDARAALAETKKKGAKSLDAIIKELGLEHSPMAYSILLAPPAERQLKALTALVQKRIAKRLKSIRENPRPHGVKKLAGEEDLYRIREGDYRIVYAIQDKKLIILVVKIGDRKEVYR